MVVFGCLPRNSHFAPQDQRGLKVKKRILSSVHAGIATPFPVRAGMVVDPAQYRWSSYRTDGVSQPDARLTPHPLCLATDAPPPHAAMHAPRCFGRNWMKRPQAGTSTWRLWLAACASGRTTGFRILRLKDGHYAKRKAKHP